INSLNSAIEGLSKELSMQPTSVRNLTRFVISSLTYTGWFKKNRLEVYGKKTVFLTLTEKGKKVYRETNEAIDLYGRDLPDDKELVSEISNYSFLTMLKFAEFEVDNDLKMYDSLKKVLKEKHNKENILFSPFQYF